MMAARVKRVVWAAGLAAVACGVTGWGATGGATVHAEEPQLRAEFVFPLNDEHNHAPGIVQSAAGELLVSWYRGSGERKADDVRVLGARRKPGTTVWSEPFLMADTPDLPDCNTCMMVDAQDRLWLFWPVILANTWESCLTQYRIANRWDGEGAPSWNDHGQILLKPTDFAARAEQLLDKELAAWPRSLTAAEQAEVAEIRRRLSDKLFQRLGWQPRCKPTVLPTGRILLPLYTDTFSFSIMAISDDHGQTWHASGPLIGFGNIQPAVLVRTDGTLVAYMRENGALEKIRVAESLDHGDTWGPVGTMDLPNPGAGIDAVRLRNGHWVLIYNDTTSARNSLAVALSTDEGRTWPWVRHLEQQPEGSYHYPAIIEGTDGLMHAVYSYFVVEGKTMKHAEFNETWIRSGEELNPEVSSAD